MLQNKKQRSTRGSALEFTAVAPIFALFILVPMMDLGAVALRTTFLTVAARDAVHRAIKARSFEADLIDSLSAKTMASQLARGRAESFGGVRVKQVISRIVVVSLDGSTPAQKFEHPLPPAPEPDTKTAVYQLEVEVQGEVDPLLPAGGVFAELPGLSKPMAFTSVAREVFEDPSALTL